MFKKDPSPDSQLDEIESAIESHRIQSRLLFKELDNYTEEIKNFQKRNLKRPLVRALNGYKSIKSRIEVIEETRMRLIDVRNVIKYTPDNLDEKSFTAVNKLIRDAEIKLSRSERHLTQLDDITNVRGVPESDLALTDTEISSLLQEIGIENQGIEIEPKTTKEPVTVFGDMPELPEEIREEILKEEKEKSKLQEEKA